MSAARLPPRVVGRLSFPSYLKSPPKGAMRFQPLYKHDVMFLKHSLVTLTIVTHFYRGLILTPKIGRLSVQADESPKLSSLSSKMAGLQRFSLNLVKTNLVLGRTVLLLTGISSSLSLAIRFIFSLHWGWQLYITGLYYQGEGDEVTLTPYITRLSLGLGVIPGILPRLAMGLPSTSCRSAVKSIGLAPLI